MNNLESYIDHTLLAPYAGREMIEALCMGAREHGFKAVCVNPYWIKTATAILADCDVLIATVVGFPIGATFPSVKAEEARMAVAEGADEIDMVINIGALLSGQTTAVARDIDAVREAAGKAVLKVILETCLLNQAEIILACNLAVQSGADFVKTSTGFAADGATLEAVRIMRDTVGPETGVKASGGIRTREQAIAMIEAGASRIGTSAGVKICKG